jgi:hypothetical protein
MSVQPELFALCAGSGSAILVARLTWRPPILAGAVDVLALASVAGGAFALAVDATAPVLRGATVLLTFFALATALAAARHQKNVVGVARTPRLTT